MNNVDKMNNNHKLLGSNNIKDRIYLIRGKKVMLDSDLALLYEVETKRLNERVKRNLKRFPSDFMFQLSKDETFNLMPQIATSRLNWGGRRKLPFVFTEQGIATLSGILNSNTAIEVNIKIMRAFVKMREFLTSNGEFFFRLNHLEKRQIEHEKKFKQVFNAIENKSIKCNKGIFFDEQVFDSYKFVSDIIRSAKKSIILIDNYIDDSVLIHFSKRKKNVKVEIYTKQISNQLKLDLEKFNSQYPPIELKKFTKSHDRFLIIDDKEVYHIGASLKDLGKKWFAFSKLDDYLVEIKNKLNN
jgi:hypothetical protein